MTTPPSPALDLPAIRARLTLRQEDLAYELGVSTRTISRWELGRRPHRIYEERIIALLKRRIPSARVPRLLDREPRTTL
jgi:DNA-binding transcriptional regulator YiaG